MTTKNITNAQHKPVLSSETTRRPTWISREEFYADEHFLDLNDEAAGLVAQGYTVADAERLLSGK